MTGIVLLIACINLANMLLARGSARRKEFAIRAAIGGGRVRILRQLLTEGLLLSVLGGVAGLLISYWVNTMLAASMNRLLVLSSLAMDILWRAAPDGRVLVATVGFCLFGTLSSASGRRGGNLAPMSWWTSRTRSATLPGSAEARVGGTCS